MSRFGRWLIYFWVYLTVFCFIIVAVNYIVDPFGEQNRWVEQKYKPLADADKRLKYNYLFSQNHMSKYDGIIVGSSRTWLIHPDKIPVISKSYNFGISSATLKQSYFVIKESIQMAGPQLKYVLLGIDFFAFDTKADTTTMREVQEQFTARNSYAAYLLSFDTLELSIEALKKMHNDDAIHYFQENGGFVFASWDKEIAIGNYNPPDWRMFTDAKNRYLSFERMKYNPNGIQYLREIKELCDKNGVKLIPIVTPEHRMLFGFLGSNPSMHQDYLRLRKDLLQVFDRYYDFGGLNSINNSASNFYDNVHFRTYVGEDIVNRSFGVSDAKLPPDFGVVVTRNNIDSHIYKLDKQLDEASSMVKAFSHGSLKY